MIRQEIDLLLRTLFPLNRSLTGDGNRQTLSYIKEILPIKILELKSGEAVFDWEIPPEWNCKEAWIKNQKGEKIVDFANCNVHLMGYSVPVENCMSFVEELLHSSSYP